ncbi:hypothetical protein D047_4787B, partial [Vibrio parahaemolyticus VPTS-2010_2]
ESAYRH